MPPCVEEVPGQKRKRKGVAKLQDFHQWYLAACEWVWWGRARAGGSACSSRGLGSVPTDQILSKMPSTLTAGGPGERARPLQVRLGSRAHSAERLPPLGLGAPKAVGGRGRGAGQGVGAPLTRALCVDMEVLYWKHVKEQLETLRRLQRREASSGHRLEPAWSQVGDGSVPHRCCLHTDGGAVAAEA